MAEFLIIATLIIAFGYPVFLRWQLERTKPVRDRMLDLGEEMLACSGYSEHQKCLITEMLHDALDWRIMAQAVWSTPRLVLKAARRPKDEDVVRLLEDEKFREFVELHFESATAASPILGLLFRLEIVLAAIFLGLLLMVPYLVVAVFAKAATRVGHRNDWKHAV